MKECVLVCKINYMHGTRNIFNRFRANSDRTKRNSVLSKETFKGRFGQKMK